ncbi:MAG: hypothetical protein EA398_04825 [Deltaproteobacteria bacterium]|nr:MAG: hypothetical protein EA398_04825 [Deltaproteobacteria bacterium]
MDRLSIDRLSLSFPTLLVGLAVGLLACGGDREEADAQSRQVASALTAAPVADAGSMPVAAAREQRPFSDILLEPLEETLADVQRSHLLTLDKDAEEHPEIGLRHVGDPPGSWERLDLRRAAERTLVLPDGTLEAQRHASPVFRAEGGALVWDVPQPVHQGDRVVDVRGSTLLEVPARLSTGAIRLEDKERAGTFTLMRDLEVRVNGRRDSGLLTTGEARIEDDAVLRFAGGAHDWFVRVLREGIHFRLQLDRAALPERIESVEVSWDVAAPADWRPVQTDDPCAGLMLASPSGDMVRVSAPSVWDAADPVSRARRAPSGHGCGTAVSMRAIPRTEGLRVTVVVDGEWLAASDRTWPVTLDPYVEVVRAAGTGRFGTLTGPPLLPWNNFGGSGWYGNADSERAHLNFPLPAIPSGAAPAQVRYRFEIERYFNHGTGQNTFAPRDHIGVRWVRPDQRPLSSQQARGLVDTGQFYRGGGTGWTAPIPPGWTPVCTGAACAGTHVEGEAPGETGVNDTPETAEGPFANLPFGTTLRLEGHLSEGDRDVWGFVFPEGSRPGLEITLSGPDGTGCPVDGVIEFGTAAGAVLRSAEGNPITGACATLQWESITPAGGYVVTLRGFTGLESGAYRLTVNHFDSGQVDEGGLGPGAWILTSSLGQWPDLIDPYAESDGDFLSVQFLNPSRTPEAGESPLEGRFRISAVLRASSNRDWIAVRYVMPITGPVLGFTNTGRTWNSLSWAWTPFIRATGYQLFEHEPDSLVASTGGTSITEGPVGENDCVDRKVRAVNQAGPADFSVVRTACTLVRNPTTADFEVTRVGNEFQVTVRDLPNRLEENPPGFGDNLTAFRIGTLPANAADSAWNNSANIQPWINGTSTSFPAQGQANRRICVQFRNREGVITSIACISPDELVPPLSPPTDFAWTDLTTSGLTWTFTDASTGETGWEIVQGTDGPQQFWCESTTPETTGTAYACLEGGWAPNTRLVNRGIRTVDESMNPRRVSDFAPQRYSVYTRVAEPGPANLQVQATGETVVRVTWCSPRNPFADLTGAQVERSLDPAFPAGATERLANWENADRGYAPGTSAAEPCGFVEDAVPAGSVIHYRIRYRNGDGVPTGWFTVSTETWGGPCCYNPLDPFDLDSNCVGVCADSTTDANFRCRVPADYGQERCDLLDRDCDGSPVTQAGVALERACYSGPPGTAGVGACRMGAEFCIEPGAWSGVCEGEVLPQPEVCDGIDNSCDGQVDRLPDGSPLTRSCYSGPSGTAGVGLCTEGLQTCTSGDWGICEGEVLPQPEVCDGQDNDCNGLVDDGLSGNRCTGGRNDCLPPPPDREPGQCWRGCRVGETSCIDAVFTCISAPPVLEMDVEILDVLNGADVDVDACFNPYEDRFCGQTNAVVVRMTNRSPRPTPASARMRLYLDSRTNANRIEDFAVGATISAGDSLERTYCFSRGTGILESQNRTLLAAFEDPNDGFECVHPDDIGQWQPVAFSAPSPEVCDGFDNNCNGEIDEYPEACGRVDLTCIYVPTKDRYMCVGLLEEEGECVDGECGADEVCGADGRCHPLCGSRYDCPTGMRCVDGGCRVVSGAWSSAEEEPAVEDIADDDASEPAQADDSDDGPSGGLPAGSSGAVGCSAAPGSHGGGTVGVSLLLLGALLRRRSSVGIRR